MSLPTASRSLLLNAPQLGLVLSLAWVSAAPFAAQEGEPPHSYSGIASQYAWDTDLGAVGAFKNIFAGRFTEDPLPDLVVHKGDTLVYLSDPGQEYFYGSFGGTVLDAVHWPKAPRDAIIASEVDQIALYEWDSFGNVMGARPFLALAPARELDLEVDPVGGASFLGMLHLDERTISFGEIQPLGCAGGCYSPVLDLDVQEEVLAWELIQWDGIAGLELLVHTPTQFRVIDSSGVDIVTPVTSADVTTILGRYFDPDLGADRGYWFTEITQDYFGILFDHRYPDLEPSTQFGPLEAGQFGFADYNGDDLLDVWFPTVTTGQAIVLYGQEQAVFPTEQTFGLDLEQSTLFPLTGDPESEIQPTTASIGATGDFDHDGDTDFFFVSDDYQHLNFVRGDVRDEDLYGPTLRDYSFETVMPEGDGGGTVEYDFVLEVGIPYPTHPRLPNGQSILRKVEISIHVQPTPSSPVSPFPRFVHVHSLPIVVLPADRSSLDRAGNAPTQLGEFDVSEFDSPGNTHPGLGPSEFITLDFPLLDDPSGAVYQFRFRLLGANDNQIGPAHVQFFTNDTQSQEILSNQYDPWGDISNLDPENGFGFHRRGGLGGFCATCP